MKIKNMCLYTKKGNKKLSIGEANIPSYLVLAGLIVIGMIAISWTI